MNYLLKSLSLIAGSTLALFYFPITSTIVLTILAAMVIAVFIRSVLSAVDFVVDVYYPNR